MSSSCGTAALQGPLCHKSIFAGYPKGGAAGLKPSFPPWPPFYTRHHWCLGEKVGYWPWSTWLWAGRPRPASRVANTGSRGPWPSDPSIATGDVGHARAREAIDFGRKSVFAWICHPRFTKILAKFIYAPGYCPIRSPAPQANRLPTTLRGLPRRRGVTK